ncbi:hypothetical protein J437_LFUL000341, partial [Ladona fulva]
MRFSNLPRLSASPPCGICANQRWGVELNPSLTHAQRERYRLRVRASDKGEGTPSFADVDVELDVVDRNNKPPVWDTYTGGERGPDGPIVRVPENVTVGTVVTSMKARFRETYKLEAMAQDKGYPPLSRTVEVQIDVVDRANNPPVWDHVVYGPIYIKENLPVGARVVSVKA